MQSTACIRGQTVAGRRSAGRAAGRRSVAVRAAAANPHAEELKATAKYIATRGKGILASDESNATTGEREQWDLRPCGGQAGHGSAFTRKRLAGLSQQPATQASCLLSGNNCLQLPVCRQAPGERGCGEHGGEPARLAPAAVSHVGLLRSQHWCCCSAGGIRACESLTRTVLLWLVRRYTAPGLGQYISGAIMFVSLLFARRGRVGSSEEAAWRRVRRRTGALLLVLLPPTLRLVSLFHLRLQEETLYQKARDGELQAGRVGVEARGCSRPCGARRWCHLTPQRVQDCALALAGTPFVDILAKSSILPGIKVDSGLQVRSLWPCLFILNDCPMVPGAVEGLAAACCPAPLLLHSAWQPEGPRHQATACDIAA